MPQRQSLPINERLERAAQLVLRSRIFYDIWIYFEGDTRADILDTTGHEGVTTPQRRGWAPSGPAPIL
jgi:hypothetical protein